LLNPFPGKFVGIGGMLGSPPVLVSLTGKNIKLITDLGPVVGAELA
jgi:hypothetical protein